MTALSPPAMAAVDDRAERAAWLAWSQVSGVGPVMLQRLRDRFGSLAVAWRAPAADLLTVERFGSRAVASLGAERSLRSPEARLADYEAKNPCFLTPADSLYPLLLKELSDPPPLLHYRGAIAPDELTGSRPLVAIVGTRTPTEYGRRWARRLAMILTQHGFVVVSGLAKGIDAEAHHGALEAGGRTIAAVGTGVNIVYPREHRDLYAAIVGAEGQEPRGLAVSEYAAGTAPSARHFPQRNRIIAGLCRATIVIEGGIKSGAIITARLASEAGREVFVLPGTLDNPQATGCLNLLASGAQPIVGELELLAALGRLPGLDGAIAPPPALPVATTVPVAASPTEHNAAAPAPAPAPKAIAPPPEPRIAIPNRLRSIFDAIGTEPTAIESIAIAANAPAEKVSVALLELELLGAIAHLPGMLYRRS